MKTAATCPPATQVLFDRAIDRDGDIVGRLASSQIFRSYRQAFEIAIGVPLTLRPIAVPPNPALEARVLDARGLLRAAAIEAGAATESPSCAEAGAARASGALRCFAGLSAAALPVRVGDKLIAFLETGHVLLHQPTATGFRMVARRLHERGIQADPAELEAAYFRTRVMSRTRYAAALRLLESFAQHLSLISNELMLQQVAAEPPSVAKARTFIAEHLDEALSLAQVARAANMSAFYFCKIFRATLGVTFTNYVARARVEKAKQILLNPHVRVSEAAYAAGFQSLSQFNRVFRRIAGEAPSAYREHVPVAAMPPPGRRRTLFAA